MFQIQKYKDFPFSLSPSSSLISFPLKSEGWSESVREGVSELPEKSDGKTWTQASSHNLDMPQ